MSTDFFGFDSPFGKWPSGGAGLRRPAAPPPPQEEDAIPLHPVEESAKPASPKVVLSHLEWVGSEFEFNGPAEVSAEGSLPQEFSHLTRVEFQVLALTPDGRREPIDKQEGFLKDGKARATVTLYWPGYREEGAPLEKCDMVFTVKHRESDLVESESVEVCAPVVPMGKVWLRLVSPKGIRLSGVECRLKGMGRQTSAKQTDRNGEVLWEKLALAEWQLELKGAGGTVTVPVPWLAVGSAVHVFVVKSPTRILGAPDSKAGLAARLGMLGFASAGEYKKDQGLEASPFTDAVAGELSSHWIG